MHAERHSVKVHDVEMYLIAFGVVPHLLDLSRFDFVLSLLRVVVIDFDGLVLAVLIFKGLVGVPTWLGVRLQACRT